MSDPKGPAGVFTDLIVEVFRLNGRLLEAGDRLTRPVGLSSARWQVLGVVDHGPASVADVARTMGLTRQSVQQTADGLEASGFVEYQENPRHRRAKLVAITAKGRKALAYVEQQQALWVERLAREHTPQQLGAALAVLRKARQQLEAEAGEAGGEAGDDG